MKIQLVNDLHTEFGDFVLPETDADVVVLAGDIGVGRLAITWAGEFIEKQVVMVLGNHEYYRQVGTNFVDWMREKAEQYPHIHLLENDQVVIGGVRFLGCTLWTDFAVMGQPAVAAAIAQEKLSDFAVIRTTPGHRPLWPEETIEWHRASHAWLEAKLAEPHDGPTVVVTHHGPSVRSIHPRYNGQWLNGAFASDLGNLVATSGAALWVHGHTHDSFDYHLGETRVVCNPRGYYPEDLNRSFDPRLVINLEGDE